VQVRQRARQPTRWVVAMLLAVVVFWGVTARLFIWPDLPPLPPHVDAIIEMAGPAVDRRDELAVELAREHRSNYLVQSTTAVEAATHDCLPAVPHVTVLCFHPDPNTTRGEARYIAEEAARLDWRSVILVTTPDQAWRARLWTTRCFSYEVYIATAPLPALLWIAQLPYQWAATIKAFTVTRSC
jgi:hypothetical protein